MLTMISSFSSFMCFTNVLWRKTFISYELGRSSMVNLGLIATRTLRNAGLLVSAKGYRYIMGYVFDGLTCWHVLDCLSQSAWQPVQEPSPLWIHVDPPLTWSPVTVALSSSLYGHTFLFLFLYSFPNVPWNCPISYWYICLVTLLLV